MDGISGFREGYWLSLLCAWLVYLCIEYGYISMNSEVLPQTRHRRRTIISPFHRLQAYGIGGACCRNPGSKQMNDF